MAGRTPMAADRIPSARKAVFLALQVLVAVEGFVLLIPATVQFLAAAGGDPTPLFLSTLLILLSASLFYSAVALRTRGSSPFFATLVASLLALLILASLGSGDLTRLPGIGLTVAAIVVLGLLRNRFHLRPGEIVKEEKLPPEVLAKIATRVRGVRCRECGDDDVWITSDKLLVCRNCGSTNA